MGAAPGNQGFWPSVATATVRPARALAIPWRARGGNDPTMRSRIWLATPLLAVAFLLPGWLAPQQATSGHGDDDSHYVRRRKPGRCLCRDGQGSYEYLHSPMRPVNDPPICGLLRAGGNCAAKPRPKGTPGPCWVSGKKECFFKRHAYSWQIACSACWEDEDCSGCDKLIGKPNDKTAAMLKRQLRMEGHDGRKRKLWVCVTPHFYVVTDIHNKVKALTKGGAPRVLSGHEVAHLAAERAERVYADYQHWFRGGIATTGRMAIILMRKQRVMQQYAAKYLGGATTNMIQGAGSSKRISGGFAVNGFVGCYDELRSDQAMHAYIRHMASHIFFSCWLKVAPFEKHCPKWASVGVAHFFEKLLKPHEDLVTYCTNETSAPSGPGKDWMKRARKLAAGRTEPIETFFGKNALGQFSYKDHIRAWSIVHLMLTEDKDRFLRALKLIRAGNEEGYAFQEALKLSPDGFNERWKQRLTGKRKTMGEIRKDAKGEEDPGRRERERIKTELDPDVLAGLIRGLHEIKDLKMMEAVVNRLDHESDLVREAIQLVLRRTHKHELLQWLREEGLSHSGKWARAGVTRALGAMKDQLSRELIEGLLNDDYWLVRANAATALMQIGMKESLPALIAKLGESQAKVWIAVADAVRSFGGKSKEATIKTVSGLSHKAWQVRVTACQALKVYGTAECMDQLIRRFQVESGRLTKEIYAALKAVSNDDLGKNPDTWKRWWDKQKEKYGGFDPNAPPKPTTEDEERYGRQDRAPPGTPHYYGRRIFSKSVAFVMDTSGSMSTNITVPQDASTRLGDIPRKGTRMAIAQVVLAGAIKKLNPKTRFNLVFFSTKVRPWKKNLVAASGGMKNSAEGAIMSQPPDGETNIHGALKAALGLHNKPSLTPSLDNIPDTVFFLTDGSPTRGEITATPELLGWFRNINRFGKIKLHIVAFGTLGVDLGFLRQLAEAGDGDFIHVPEER